MKRNWPAGLPLLLMVAFAGPAVLLAASVLSSQGEDGEAGPSEQRPAMRLPAGSFQRDRMVAIGRDMVVDGEALSHAVVLSGSIRVTGHVAGDVIVLDGDVHLAPAARLGGDVFVLGGVIDMASGAGIAGRSVAYPDASAMWTGLLEAPSLERSARSPVVVGAKLALLAFWAFLILLLLSLGRRELLSTSESVRTEPFRNFFVGLTGVAAMVLTGIFFGALSGVFLGVPLLALVAVAALLLRFWGMVAVFHALGEAFCHTVLKSPRPVPLVAASYGLIVLGALRFFPYLGVWVWSLATFLGVGAALNTKFGRREDWFEAA